jgi:hypothetical protein
MALAVPRSTPLPHHVSRDIITSATRSHAFVLCLFGSCLSQSQLASTLERATLPRSLRIPSSPHPHSTMTTNPPQLFLLADHIKLSLLERQRAVSLNLPSNSQDAQISRSLEQLRSGIESLESQVQDTEDEYVKPTPHQSHSF